MTARLLDGNAVAAAIRESVRPDVQAFASGAGRPPVPPAACGPRTDANAPIEQPGRQTWMAQLQCEAQAATITDG